jgi:hypothetical protein
MSHMYISLIFSKNSDILYHCYCTGQSVDISHTLISTSRSPEVTGVSRHEIGRQVVQLF